MIAKIKKVFLVLCQESKQRGLYYFFIMYLSNFMAMVRGLRFRLLFSKNIKASIFSMGWGSRIDVFNRKSRIMIEPFVFIRKNTNIRVDFDCDLFLGEKVFINDNCNINCVNKVSIGGYTKIGPNVCINDHDHSFKKNESEHLVKGEVIIGKNVWIGSNVVILRDTYIGDNAVIAAGSIVKGTVPEGTVFFNKREKKFVKY